MPVYEQDYSFNAGEFSPRLYSRSDIEKYRSGVKQMKNFIPLTYGGIVNRPGSEYIADGISDTAATKSRVFPFRYSTSTNFICELSNTKIRFYSNGAQVVVSSVSAWADATAYVEGDQVSSNSVNYVCILAHTSDDGGTPASDDGAGDNEPGYGTDAPTYWHALSGTKLELPTPYLTADLFEVQFLQVKDVVYLVHPSYHPRLLTRIADDQWKIEEVDWTRAPLLDQNPEEAYLMACSATTGTSKTLTASGTGNAPFTSDHVGAFFEIAHRRDDPWVDLAITASGQSSELWCHGTVTFETTGTWTGTVRVQQEDSEGNWETIRSYDSVDDLNVEVVFTQEVPKFLRIDLDWTSKTGSVDPRAILTASDPVHRGLVKVTGYTSSTVVTVDVIEELNGTGTTEIWKEGAFSDEQGYPRTIALHQDRVWYGGTTNEPLRFWGSASGDYRNFILGVTDGDAIDLTLSSPRNNLIQWMISQQSALIIGTSGGEFVVSASGNDATLTAANGDADQQSNYGSEFLQALLVNDSLVFLQRVGRRVRDYFYNWQREAKDAYDLTRYAEHITLGGVCQLDFSQQPLPVLWGVTGSGKLIGLTYERSEDVMGWHEHSTANGTIESVAVIPGDDADEVWISVYRSDLSKRFIERLEPYTMWHHLVSTDSTTTDEELLHFVDAGVKQTQAASVTVSNLEHFPDDTVVSVYADGATHPNATVTSGAITLTKEVEQVSVGLPIESVMETLPLVAQLRNGSSQGRIGRIHRVVLDFYRSRACQYSHKIEGEDDGALEWDAWETVSFRKTTHAMDAPPPLLTDRKDMTVAGAYTDDATLGIRVNQPQPLTLLSMTMKWDTTQNN